jgi:hypothetical protein
MPGLDGWFAGQTGSNDLDRSDLHEMVTEALRPERESATIREVMT